MKNHSLHKLFLMMILFLSCSNMMAAETPAEESIYFVAYVEVIPTASVELIAAFQSYKESSVTDEGFLSIDLFHQEGWPGHFVVIEKWTDENNLVAHSTAAHVESYQDALRPFRISGYDQRPYVPLTSTVTLTTLGSTAAANSERRYVIAHVDIGPGGQVDPLELLKDLAEASRLEIGNLSFDILQHSMRGNHFTVIESWENQAALNSHASAAHTREYRELVQPITGSPLDERLFTLVE